MPWYEKGLKFKCTECGKCCGGAPGYVWLTNSDIQRLSEHLNISEDELIKKYCRQVGNRISLKERAVNYNCIFLVDSRCSVYEGRPTQCRTYPFWGKNVASKRAWEETSLECEGINSPQADLIPLSVIRKKLQEEE